MSPAANEILSWTSKDLRQSQLFSSWGVVYRFQVSIFRVSCCRVLHSDGTSLITRTLSLSRVDRHQQQRPERDFYLACHTSHQGGKSREARVGR